MPRIDSEMTMTGTLVWMKYLNDDTLEVETTESKDSVERRYEEAWIEESLFKITDFEGTTYVVSPLIIAQFETKKILLHSGSTYVRSPRRLREHRNKILDAAKPKRTVPKAN